MGTSFLPPILTRSVFQFFSSTSPKFQDFPTGKKRKIPKIRENTEINPKNPPHLDRPLSITRYAGREKIPRPGFRRKRAACSRVALNFSVPLATYSPWDHKTVWAATSDAIGEITSPHSGPFLSESFYLKTFHIFFRDTFIFQIVLIYIFFRTPPYLETYVQLFPNFGNSEKKPSDKNAPHT